ncbi:MAG: 7-cyano-7-deazaguanine synthase QueC [Endomicrobia bacterium]|nr:7-cyano-7-deazaguanine synthase QueC [Endomicrobiia bacterium]MCL2799524.1 7-cyano-7-deazaguanine synthase QueC [Endomicrobiia bacterium]
MNKQKKAIVLFSGGLDSTTVLYYALSKKYNCLCLIFDYGQRHNKEIASAIKTAKRLKVNYSVVRLMLPWSKDVLTNKNKKVPSHKKISGTIPPTYVPGRNTLFLSFGLSCAESINAEKIFIGANALDFSGYPDCKPQFINAYNDLLKSLGLKIKVEAPLVRMTKAQIIKLGTKLKTPYQHTWSCYNGSKNPCGVCDSCKLRAKGFHEAGIKDPILKNSEE